MVGQHLDSYNACNNDRGVRAVVSEVLDVVEGRRERKKVQTRRLITGTALRLFGEQGYEQTTVAQIAETADVATKTFFNYFPSKEDVLFAELPERYEMTTRIITERGADESLSDLLARLCDRVLEFVTSTDAPYEPELLPIRTRLLTTVPALEARALQVNFELQRRISALLLEAYPDKLDPVSAAGAVGALVGAAQGALVAGLEIGQTEDQLWQSARRGIDLARDGVNACS